MENQDPLYYSLADVAKITRKSEKTIARWIKSGKLPAAKQGTGYLILATDIPLEAEAEEDASWDLATRLQHRLKTWTPESGEDMAMVTVNERAMDAVTFKTDGPLDIVSLLRRQKDEIEKIIREQNELAEKYARATYTLGQLEERNRQLDEINQKLEQKMLLLPQPEQWNNAKNLLNELREQGKQKETEYQVRLQQMEQRLGALAEEERKNQMLQEEKNKLEEKITLLPEPGEWRQTKNELEILKEQLKQKQTEAKQKELDAANKERELATQVKVLEKEKNDIREEYRRKGFFQRLFGQ